MPAIQLARQGQHRIDLRASYWTAAPRGPDRSAQSGPPVGAVCAAEVSTELQFTKEEIAKQGITKESLAKDSKLFIISRSP